MWYKSADKWDPSKGLTAMTPSRKPCHRPRILDKQRIARVGGSPQFIEGPMSANRLGLRGATNTHRSWAARFAVSCAVTHAPMTLLRIIGLLKPGQSNHLVVGQATITQTGGQWVGAFRSGHPDLICPVSSKLQFHANQRCWVLSWCDRVCPARNAPPTLPASPETLGPVERARAKVTQEELPNNIPSYRNFSISNRCAGLICLWCCQRGNRF